MGAMDHAIDTMKESAWEVRLLALVCLRQLLNGQVSSGVSPGGSGNCMTFSNESVRNS